MPDERRREIGLSKFFIAAGVLLIAVLFTALIGPHFVDWTDYRQHFEREAASYIGRPVSIRGKANVRLLPTPVLSFTDVRIGDSAAPDVEIERFRAEVELAALLKGEIRVIQMNVDRPRFRFDVADLAGGEAGSLGQWRIDPERISLARLAINEGVASIADSRAGRSWEATEIGAEVEAGSLRGPARVTAALRLDGTPMALSVALGRAEEDGTVPANVSLTSPVLPARVTAEGGIRFATAAPALYSGTVAIAGPLGEDNSEAAATAWTDLTAEGAFELTPDILALNDLKISAGALERPLVLEASGRLDYAARPRFEATVTARQIDLDSALGGGAQNPVAVESAVENLMASLPSLPPAPIPGVLRVSAQGVALGGSIVQNVEANLAAEAFAWRVERLSALLPGDTQVSVEGLLRTGAEPEFQGHSRAASARPAALATWWRGTTGSATAVDQFTLDADVDLRSGQQTFSNVKASTGEGTVTGTIDLLGFQESGERFAVVNLSADRADLVEARALTELLAGNAFASGRFDQMTISLAADVLSAGGVEAREVVLDGGVEGGGLDLRRLSVADLAGAKLDLRGRIEDPFGSPRGSIDGSVEAEDLSGAAEFLARLLPENAALSRVREIAPALSPVRAELSASAGLENQPISAALTGSFADTHLSLSVAGQGELADPRTLKGIVELKVEGEDSATVLAQLGVRAIPVRVGPLSLDARFEGAVRSAGKLTVKGRVAGIDLDYAADSSLRDGLLALSGTFSAEAEDIDPVLLLAGVAAPDIGQGHSVSAAGKADWSNGRLLVILEKASLREQPVSGTVEASFGEDIALAGSLKVQEVSLPVLAGFALGHVPEAEGARWSETPFAAALPANLNVRMDLRSEVLDLGLPQKASKANLSVRYASDGFEVEVLEAAFAGGALKGAVGGALRDGEAEVSIRGSVQGAAIPELAWLRSGTPVASGLMDLSLEAGARGRSMAGLVSSLAGSGSLAIREGRLNGINSAALAAVARLAEAEDDPQDDEGREIFATRFNTGTLEFGSAAASIRIQGGIVETGTVSAQTADTAVLAEASIDLKTLSLASNWTIRALEEAVAEHQQPFVRLTFSGPVARPERQVDLRPLLDLVQTRRMQHQLDELDRLQREQRAEPTGALPAPAGNEALAAGSGAEAERRPVPQATPAAVPADDGR